VSISLKARSMKVVSGMLRFGRRLIICKLLIALKCLFLVKCYGLPPPKPPEMVLITVRSLRYLGLLSLDPLRLDRSSVLCLGLLCSGVLTLCDYIVSFRPYAHSIVGVPPVSILLSCFSGLCTPWCYDHNCGSIWFDLLKGVRETFSMPR